jgi:predicted DNA-binding transcriptional regulator AlpA
MMADWSVRLEARSLESLALDDPRIDVLIDLVVPYAGAVAYGGDDNVLDVTMSIEAPDAVQAVHRASKLLLPLVQAAGFSIEPVREVRAREAEALSAELERSNFPDIVGTTEAAELLGMSRQRIHELRSAGRFPEPMVELAAGPIWLRRAIEAFAEVKRPGGRPKKRNSPA